MKNAKLGDQNLDNFLQNLDGGLNAPTSITVMGAAVLIILGMRNRQTMDVDVQTESDFLSTATSFDFVSGSKFLVCTEIWRAG